MYNQLSCYSHLIFCTWKFLLELINISLMFGKFCNFFSSVFSRRNIWAQAFIHCKTWMIFTYIQDILAFSRTYQKLQVFASNACANNFWNVSNAHAKRVFLVTWVHSFTHVLHLSYHAFPCDREVGKVWCNWNKLNATLYTAHGVSKGELIFMFWWFWYRFFKNFSPRRRDLWNLNSS